jgi:chemotaxis protein CheY-P-specific phosphatase CheC
MDNNKSMNIINLPVITTESIEEIRSIFKSTYLSTLLKFEGITLKIFPEDFEHLCYEDSEGDVNKNKLA